MAVHWRGITRYLAHGQLKVWQDADGIEKFQLRAQAYPKRAHERLFGPVEDGP